MTPKNHPSITEELNNRSSENVESNKGKIDETGKQEIELIDCIYQNEKFILPASELSQSLHDRSNFGTYLPDQSLELEIYETLLLLERKRIQVYRADKFQSEYSPVQIMYVDDLLKEYVKIEPRIWVNYLVYRDLRQRGYMVRMGYGNGITFRLFPRGVSPEDGIAKHFIFILDEGNPIYLQKLDQITKQTLKARKELIIAIVDRLGDPTYYQLEQFKLPINAKKEINW
ncbi:MAG: tRNA-intron lyase [Promethearchaeota archaeon]